jgi:hypothetical protein
MDAILRKTAVSILLLGILSPAIRGQTSKDSIVRRQAALRDDYIHKIKAMGFIPSLSPPKIILDNPRSWGNYDDSANTIETCDWHTLPPEQRAVFADFANKKGNGMTGERFFQLAVYQWIFVHELSHWWRACQHQTAEPYENEKAANRLASAYWRERDPSFYKFMLSVFSGVVGNSPSPVPPGQSKEKYLNDNYQKLPGGQAYSWYQSIMIIEVSQEIPVSFEEAVKNSGKELHAQGPVTLTGTAWKGILDVPSPTECELKFTKDTVRLIYVGSESIRVRGEDGMPRDATGKDSVTIELMTYTVSGDSLQLRKVAGGSPCSDELGIYQVKKKDGKLQLILISDACMARQYCFKADMTLVK